MSERRHHLRNATARVHADLEKLLPSIRTTRGYIGFVEAQLAYRLPCEAVLRSQVGRFSTPVVTEIAADLLADARDLGLTAAAPPALRPQSLCASAMLGMAYVLEGSAFGARLLLRQAGELGYDAGFGARHLARQAGAVAWPGLMRELDAVEPYDPDAATAAALQTFTSARLAFEGATHDLAH